MIKSLSPDTAPRGLDRPLRAEKKVKDSATGPADFASQILGAKDGESESSDRSERSVRSTLQNSRADSTKSAKRNPGRDTSDGLAENREGPRSKERDLDSQTPVKKANKAGARSNAVNRGKNISQNDQRELATGDRRVPQIQRLRLDEASDVRVDNGDSEDSGENKVRAQSASATGAAMTLPDFSAKESVVGAGATAAPLSFANGRVAGERTQASDKSIEMLQAMRMEQVKTREQAMSEFLDKMDSQLGISRERVLNAFSNLSPETLAAPPDETMNEVLQGLELKPEQVGTAKSLYKEMLRITGDAALNEKFIGMEEGVNFDVISKRDASLRSLNSALDDLNSSFFSNGIQAKDALKTQHAVESMDAELARLMAQQPQGGEQDDQVLDPAMNGDPSGKNAALYGGAAIGAGGARAAGLNANNSVVGKASGELSERAAKADFANDTLAMNSEPMGKAATNGDAQSAMADFSDNTGDANLFSAPEPEVNASASPTAASSSARSFAGEIAEAQSASTAKASSGRGGASVAKAQAVPANTSAALANGSEIAAAGANQSVAPGQTAAAASAATGPAAMIMNRPATPEEEQENVRELIKQAQVVLKNGGGEMHLQMKPEGMGHVRLKVAVEDGQVNVQMLTETDSAKRLLEKGLGDLKASLASHDLRVEHMKVDVGSEIRKHMDQEASREQERQFAQNFMGSFRDERQEFRDGTLASNPRWRQYGRDTSRGSTEEPTASAASTRRSGGGRRLNVVA